MKRAELKECGELEARRMLTNGDTSAQRVVHILTKIAERDHPSLFYSGGFRALSGLLNTGIWIHFSILLMDSCIVLNSET